jgi:hypothetical protein
MRLPYNLLAAQLALIIPRIEMAFGFRDETVVINSAWQNRSSSRYSLIRLPRGSFV